MTEPSRRFAEEPYVSRDDAELEARRRAGLALGEELRPVREVAVDDHHLAQLLPAHQPDGIRHRDAVRVEILHGVEREAQARQKTRFKLKGDVILFKYQSQV